MEYVGIIFDLDGTIVDTVHDLHDALNAVLEKNHFPQVTLEQTRDYIGNGYFNLLKKAFPDEFKEDTEFINQNLKEFEKEYRQRIVNKSKAYPGISDILLHCNINDIMVGVASNKSDAETKLLLNKLFPYTYFNQVEGHIEGEPLKPHPKIIFRMLHQMSLEPEDVLYIGDSITDYQTAKNAGMKVVLVTYGYEDKEVLDNLPDAVLVENTEELFDFIKQNVTS